MTELEYLTKIRKVLGDHILTVESLAAAACATLIDNPGSQRVIAELIGRFIIEIAGNGAVTNLTEYLCKCGFDKDVIIEMSILIQNSISRNQAKELEKQEG